MASRESDFKALHHALTIKLSASSHVVGTISGVCDDLPHDLQQPWFPYDSMVNDFTRIRYLTIQRDYDSDVSRLCASTIFYDSDFSRYLAEVSAFATFAAIFCQRLQVPLVKTPAHQRQIFVFEASAAILRQFLEIQLLQASGSFLNCRLKANPSF